MVVTRLKTRLIFWYEIVFHKMWKRGDSVFWITINNEYVRKLLHIGRSKQASSFWYTACLFVCVCKCACIGKSEGVLLPLSTNGHCFAIPLSLNQHCFTKKELNIIEIIASNFSSKMFDIFCVRWREFSSPTREDLFDRK